MFINGRGRPIYVLTLVILGFLGCQKQVSLGKLETLAAMDNPEYKGEPVSKAAITEVRKVLKRYNDDIEQQIAGIEELGGLYRNLALRYLDIDRKNVTPSRSLEAAKYLDGETDWRSSIYGNRMPHQYNHPLNPPTINITNSGSGNISWSTNKSIV